MIVIFGVLGYLFEKFKFPISRTVLGAIVGPVSATAFMPSLIASEGRLDGIFQGTDLRHIDGRFAAGTGYPLLREIFVMLRRAATVGIPGEQR
jgi:putative tricarboxylic transport membrane protein